MDFKLHWQIFLAFAIYISILLTIGLLSHRKSRTEGDFIMGNRSLSFWLTALSAHAADMSAWLFMALPAAIFIGGIPQVWIGLGLLAGMYCNWQFVAPKLRALTEKFNSYTLSTFFEKRFEDKSNVLRLLTAFLTLVFMISYISAGLIAMGYLFESIFGIDYYVGIVLSVIVMMGYTFFGGFVAVAWTDLFQALFLLFVVIFVPFFALKTLGGWVEIEASAVRLDIPLQLFEDYSLTTFAGILLLAFGWGLGYFGQPHIVTKFMGIRNVEEMHKAKWVGMTWMVLALGGAILIGIVGIGYFPNGIDNNELVFVQMVKDLFVPFCAGFVLCAILAANLSTIDSQILVCASVISEDVYRKLFNREAKSIELLKASRAGVVIASLLSLAVAFSKSSTVADTVFYSWNGLGSSFGPLVLASLYSKRINQYGAIAGVLVGGLTGGLWPLLNPLVTDIVVPAMIPGYLFAFAAMYGVSSVTQHQARNK